MAAVARPKLAEDGLPSGPPARRLVSDGGRFLPARTGPISNKEHPTPATGVSGRNAGGAAALDSSDLDCLTVSLRAAPTAPAKDGRYTPPAADPCHLTSEIEALHAALKQKDLLLASLQSQMLSACQSRSSREAERDARERERALLLERSAHLQHQIDRRRAHVKNARLTLDQLDTAERNIDDCIRRAELEYRLETEELNILNLQGEHLRLRSRLEGSEDDSGPTLPAVSLSSCLPSHSDVSLHCLTVTYDPDSPCFSVTETATEAGALVNWVNDECSLCVGDRLLEINGHPVVASNSSSSSGSSSSSSSSGGGGCSSGPAVRRLLAEGGSPLRLLAVRCRPPSLGRPAAAAAALQQELAQLAGRLQQKTQLNKALRAEARRSADETAACRAENHRLIRRVRQLELRVQQMQGILDKIRGVTDESLCAELAAGEDSGTLFAADSPPPSRVPDGASDHERSPQVTRDPHLISVNVRAEPSVPPSLCLSMSSPSGSSLPPSPTTPSLPASPTTPSFSACPSMSTLPTSPTTLSPPASPAGAPSSPRSPPASSAPSGDRMAATGARRPQPAPRPRSLLQRLQLFGERRLQGAAASLQRPRPPQKPARLSLQRAVSLQALQQAEQAEEPCRPVRPAVQTWPSMDGNLEMVRQRSRGIRVRHQVCSLPRPGRLNATRPVPI